ncbi:MAG: hypothetical protein OSA40_13245 [Phycisphaerales bacterium]|nr:hypothetical protein [Phycisphaerales bacterium]
MSQHVSCMYQEDRPLNHLFPVASMRPVQDSAEGAETAIETIPVDGDVGSSAKTADQDAFLLIAFPVILLIAGAILHLAKRRPAGSPEACMTPGEKGGVILMGIGALFTGLMFVYLMIA